VKGHVDVTYLPQGDGPNASHAATLGGWQLMLSAYSKNKDAAAKLIKYMVSFETQKDHAIKLSRLPTRPAVYEDKDVLAAQPLVFALTARFRQCSSASFDGGGRQLQQSVYGCISNNESDSQWRDTC